MVIMGKFNKTGRKSKIHQKIPYEGNFGGNFGRKRPIRMENKGKAAYLWIFCKKMVISIKRQ